MSVVEDQSTVNITNNNGDHERFAHVVFPASAVTKAYITGCPVTALCGKVWVPSRAPDRFPVCPECREVLKQLGHDI